MARQPKLFNWRDKQAHRKASQASGKYGRYQENGKICKIEASVSSAATQSCAVLCTAAPQTAIPIYPKRLLFDARNIYIASVLSTPPARLIKKRFRPA